jgi:hypothetical protein
VTLNDVAWNLATGPIEQRDPESAVMAARRFVELVPGQQRPLIILGATLYHSGQYPEATSVLERSLAARKEELDELDDFGLFFLAMAHHGLGHVNQARDCFDRAVRSWGERKHLSAGYFQELTGLRAEAEAVLGLARPSGELPGDVFAPRGPDQP